MSDFLITRGDDVTFNLAFTDDSTTPSEVDITGWTIYLTLKKDIDDSDDDAAVAKDYSGDDLTDPENGKTTIGLGHSDTAILFGNYYYDIQYKDDSGNIKTITDGSMYVKKDVTQRII